MFNFNDGAWIFVGVQEQLGTRYLGFRKIEGPGSIFDEEWHGDLYVQEDFYLEQMTGK
jgi:hypothetical protein